MGDPITLALHRPDDTLFAILRAHGQERREHLIALACDGDAPDELRFAADEILRGYGHPGEIAQRQS